VLQADLVQAESVLIKPSEIAIKIISVGVDGTGLGPKLGGEGIEPQLGQSLIGAHDILL
jgi:hypothetical protein